MYDHISLVHMLLTYRGSSKDAPSQESVGKAAHPGPDPPLGGMIEHFASNFRHFLQEIGVGRQSVVADENGKFYSKPGLQTTDVVNKAVVLPDMKAELRAAQLEDTKDAFIKKLMRRAHTKLKEEGRQTENFGVDRIPFMRDITQRDARGQGTQATVVRITANSLGETYNLIMRQADAATPFEQKMLKKEVEIIKILMEKQRTKSPVEYFSKTYVDLTECFNGYSKCTFYMDLYEKNFLELLSEGGVMTLDDVKQLLRGLKFMHDLNIAHLDIKPENILVKGGGGRNRLVYTDFGFAERLENKSDTRSIFKGTIYYIHPDIWNGRYNPFVADIWALGATIYEGFVKEILFDGDDDSAIRINATNFLNKEERFYNYAQQMMTKHMLRESISLPKVVNACLSLSLKSPMEYLDIQSLLTLCESDRYKAEQRQSSRERREELL